MKKIIYILLFSFITALSISSCTDEQVKPQEGGQTGGGSGSLDPLK